MAPLRNANQLPPPGMSKVRGFGGCVVVMVGLPARGKTCLAHKIQRYINWTNPDQAKVFSVSEYRRRAEGVYSSHEFFNSTNSRGRRVRENCTLEAMHDAADWLANSPNNKIAILDGNHGTESVRMMVYEFFKQMSVKILFIESINENIPLLERNILDILCRCEDYRRMDFEEAVEDFQLRLEHYIDQYSTISSPQEQIYSYIKLFNDGEDMMVHRLEGLYQTRILSFVSNYRQTKPTIFLSRHGESEYNLTGRIGGDAPLSERGAAYAKALASYFNISHRVPNLNIWTSTKQRTKQTAEFIDGPKQSFDQIDEIDAGVCEGLTYEEVADGWPQDFALRDRDKLRYRYPMGESYLDLMERVEPLLLEVEHQTNPLLVISHQAVLRTVLAYFLPPNSPDEIPYIKIPLHTIIKLTPHGFNWSVEYINLNVKCVDTQRDQPKNCSVNRSFEDALATVPPHLESVVNTS